MNETAKEEPGEKADMERACEEEGGQMSRPSDAPVSRFEFANSLCL